MRLENIFGGQTATSCAKELGLLARAQERKSYKDPLHLHIPKGTIGQKIWPLSSLSPSFILLCGARRRRRRSFQRKFLVTLLVSQIMPKNQSNELEENLLRRAQKIQDFDPLPTNSFGNFCAFLHQQKKFTCLKKTVFALIEIRKEDDALSQQLQPTTERSEEDTKTNFSSRKRNNLRYIKLQAKS